jgi:hypothetical protein
MERIKDITNKKCRGKWMTHKLGKSIVTSNAIGETFIQKKCERCGKYIYWEMKNEAKILL